MSGAKYGNNKLVRRGIRRDFINALLRDIEDSADIRTDIRREVEETIDFLATIDDWENEMLDNFCTIKRCIYRGRQNPERRGDMVGELEDVVAEIKKLKAKVHEIFPFKPREEASDRAGKSKKLEVGESSNNYLASDQPSVYVEPWLREDFVGLDSDKVRRWAYRLLIMCPAEKPVKMRVLRHCWAALNDVDYSEEFKMRRALTEFDKFFYNDLIRGRIRVHNDEIDSCTIPLEFHRQLVSLTKIAKFNECLDRESTLHFYEEGETVKAMLNRNQKHLTSKYIANIPHILQEKGKVPEIHVAQFGRWDDSAMEAVNQNDYIEADGIRFLETMGEKVRYLSLNGISRIEELPESVGKWRDLVILDLRDCHNFQKWPQKPKATMRVTLEENQWFRRLSYLDVTGCYLLDHMPKWLPELSTLHVLKGAVFNGFITDQCRLRDIKRLRNLTKLSMKIIHYEVFAVEDVTALEHLDMLLVLTIIWGGQELAGEMEIKGGFTVEPLVSSDTSDWDESLQYNGPPLTEIQCRENSQVHLKIFNSTVNEREEIDKDKMMDKEKQGGKTMLNNWWIGKKKPAKNKDNPKMPIISFPKSLAKLDLRCYPNEMAPELDKAAQLENLERLYIRGGKLRKLTGVGYQKVQILRLRFLSYLEKVRLHDMDGMFPALRCVDFEQCGTFVSDGVLTKFEGDWRARLPMKEICVSGYPSPKMLRSIY